MMLVRTRRRARRAALWLETARLPLMMLVRTRRRARRAALWLETARLLGVRPVWLGQRTAVRHALAPGARNAIYSRIWRESADRVGAQASDLGRGFVDIRRGNRLTRVFQQVTMLDDPVTLRLALDRMLVHRLLQEQEIPIPEHVEFPLGNLSRALDLIQRVGPCVVKPATGTAGGDGVTVGVADRFDLSRACLVAAPFAETLVAERMAPGCLHRLLFLDGVLLDVIVNQPPSVDGDGCSTIEELITAENRRRLQMRGEAGLELWSIDMDTALTLRREGLRLSSVLAAGQSARVKSVSNDHRLEDNITYRGEIHPTILDHARRAVAAVGLRCAGVDLVAPDLTRPLSQTKGAIIEVNGAPGIHRHYHVADRDKATPVAEQILKCLLA
jgi:cyanophycin synthetase